MTENLQAQIDIYLTHLDGLIRRGHQLRDQLAADPLNQSTSTATRVWQEDCGVTMNQLSGGSKAHWLARSFSEAFLMRSPTGDAAVGAAPEAIVQRLIDVLGQAVASLSRKDQRAILSVTRNAPAPRRFEFVHNPELRLIVEQAYMDSKRLLEQGEYDLAMRTSCGILEAIVTDALEHKGPSGLAAAGAPEGKIADWAFATRLAVAEKAGLIRSGCARLPAIARTYREHGKDGPNPAVSERDARVTGQVLHVVMRDLNPGR